MKLIVNIFILCCFFPSLIAQMSPSEKEHETATHSLIIKPQFLQLKDQFNYGLVNNGLQITVDYTYDLETNNSWIAFDAEIGFGFNYRQGLGMAWNFSPGDFTYAFKIVDRQKLKVHLGPYAAVFYQWQMYTELQSGHLFWCSSFEIGPRIRLSFPLKNNVINASVANSVLSVNSRPLMSTETHFYSATFGDFIKEAHTNMLIGSENQYTHLNIKIDLLRPDRRFDLGYEMDYAVYYFEPEFKQLSHTIAFKWKIGSRKL